MCCPVQQPRRPFYDECNEFPTIFFVCRSVADKLPIIFPNQLYARLYTGCTRTVDKTVYTHVRGAVNLRLLRYYYGFNSVELATRNDARAEFFFTKCQTEKEVKTRPFVRVLYARARRRITAAAAQVLETVVLTILTDRVMLFHQFLSQENNFFNSRFTIIDVTRDDFSRGSSSGRIRAYNVLTPFGIPRNLVATFGANTSCI